jgi:hypothetical protein
MTIEADPCVDLAPPEPSPELRARILVAARRAMAGRGEIADPWIRIWRSRPVRLGWAAILVALVLGHVLVGVAERSVPAPARVGLVGEATDTELAEVVELARLTVELPGWEIRVTASGVPSRIGKETP